jgi:hypothetical protein
LGGFLIFPELSNFGRPPAEPGVYLKEIKKKDFSEEEVRIPVLDCAYG